MADFTLLDSFPAPVRVFIRRAQACGLEYREGYDDEGQAIASLHGDVATFQALPEMASPPHRVPLTSGKWWLKVGIVGTLHRDGDRLTAVIDWTRKMGPRTRFEAAQRAAADRDFAAFMDRALQPVDVA
jgi:hypothetical protein